MHILKSIILFGLMFVVLSFQTNPAKAYETHEPAPTIQAHDVKLAMPIPGHARTAVYMTLSNDTDHDERLVGAELAIAERAEIHTMIMDDGVMKMRELENGLLIKAGDKAVLKSGGNHVMLFGVSDALKPGDKIDIKLIFDVSGTVETTAEVIKRKDLVKDGQKH